MIIRRARTIGNALRHYTGEVRGPGGGKFSEREHAQEEQYFRKKVHLLSPHPAHISPTIS